jgi:hypothetical protein
VESSNRIFFRDFMKPDFETLSLGMHLVMKIIEIVDYKLYQHLHNAELEPFFCTSWVITWFAHDLKSLNEVSRIYDALLCSHPFFIFFLSVSVRIYYYYLLRLSIYSKLFPSFIILIYFSWCCIIEKLFSIANVNSLNYMCYFRSYLKEDFQLMKLLPKLMI